MSLFVIDDKHIVIQPELQKIEAFKVILGRDKDKAKRNAYNELAYVYFLADYKSPYLTYSEKERHLKLVKDLRLGNEWKPDIAIKNAIDKYRELNETPAMRTLRIVKETLTTAVSATQSLRVKIEESLAKYENGETLDDGSPAVDIVQIINAVTSLLGLSEKIPKMIATLSAIEEKVKKEAVDERIYGGGKAGEFED